MVHVFWIMSAHTENGFFFASDLFYWFFFSFSLPIFCRFLPSLALISPRFRLYISQSDRIGDSFLFFSDQNYTIASLNIFLYEGIKLIRKELMCVFVCAVYMYIYYVCIQLKRKYSGMNFIFLLYTAQHNIQNKCALYIW